MLLCTDVCKGRAPPANLSRDITRTANLQYIDRDSVRRLRRRWLSLDADFPPSATELLQVPIPESGTVFHLVSRRRRRWQPSGNI